jgi:hypothetical protein
MTEYTPKPWRVEARYGEYCIMSGKNHLIATVEGLVGEYEKDPYDANLMAASPAMFEAHDRIANDHRMPTTFRGATAIIEQMKETSKAALELAKPAGPPQAG